MKEFRKQCFVIMPFSQTSKHDAKYWGTFYTTFVKPALEHYGYITHKSVAASNNITKGIIRDLGMADLVLAVLTGDNRNVFYELGVRHSLRQGTIMIMEGEDRPFDITNYGILDYKDGDLEKFKADLQPYITAVEKRVEDSPVADFLNQRITVSVNLAIARLRQCVEFLTATSQDDFSAACKQINEMQRKDWFEEREQVTIISMADNIAQDRMMAHVQESTLLHLPVSEWWRDEMAKDESHYPMMRRSESGFRIVQIKQNSNRLSALAWETVRSHKCLVVAEAHYYQETKPY